MPPTVPRSGFVGVAVFTVLDLAFAMMHSLNCDDDAIALGVQMLYQTTKARDLVIANVSLSKRLGKWYHVPGTWQSRQAEERNNVSKNKAKPAQQVARNPRRKLSAEESLQRMKEFDKRKESFIATLRKSKDRGLSS
jgi:hypothetical protein